MCPWKSLITWRTQETLSVPPWAGCSPWRCLQCQGSVPGSPHVSQGPLPYPRDHHPIAGIVSQSQGLFLHQGLFPYPRDQGPTGKAARTAQGEADLENLCDWGDGNVAKQLLPASDSSVPQHLCQITRINTGWSPSRGAGNSQHDV